MNCAWCEEAIVDLTERVVTVPEIRSEGHYLVQGHAVYHVECLIRSVVGSVAHQKRECSCFLGQRVCQTEARSARDDAREALAFFNQKHPSQHEGADCPHASDS